MGHLAIIGCGFAGTSALYQAVNQALFQTITVFERSGLFGPGFAYHPDEVLDYLINNTADTMGVEPGHRTAFWEWLQREGLAQDPKGHYPRAWFGRFLTETFEQTRLTAETRGIQVECLAEEILELKETDDRVFLSWEGGSLAVDAVLLTTGRGNDKDPYPHPGSQGPLYFPTHIPGQALDSIPEDAHCHILGASLSAYDVVNRLFSPATGCQFQAKGDTLEFLPGPNQRRVSLYSRSGRLKKIQNRYPRKPAKALTSTRVRELAQQAPLTLDRLASLVVEDAAQAGWQPDWNSVLRPYSQCHDLESFNRRAAEILEKDILAAVSPEITVESFLVDYVDHSHLGLWEVFACGALEPESEQTYRQHYETALLSYHAACPAETGQRLLALLRAGRLVVKPGIQEVALERDHYRLAHAYGSSLAKILINTTGQIERRVDSPAQRELIRNLYRDSRLRPHRVGNRPGPGAAIDLETFLLRDSKRVYLVNQLLWGPGFFVSSARMMSLVVQKILSHLRLLQS